MQSQLDADHCNIVKPLCADRSRSVLTDVELRSVDALSRMPNEPQCVPVRPSVCCGGVSCGESTVGIRPELRASRVSCNALRSLSPRYCLWSFAGWRAVLPWTTSPDGSRRVVAHQVSAAAARLLHVCSQSGRASVPTDVERRN
jgi:hypothetical protein